MNAGTVFLDKDGTVVEDVPYNVEPDRTRLAPGVEEGLRMLDDVGYRLVMVSNQSGVAHGYFPEEALQPVETRVRTLLEDIGVELTGFYYCPHHPEGVDAAYTGECNCRKPAPGLLLEAADEHDVDLARSWMIGDILHDVEAGRRARCRTVLIDNGNETEWNLSRERMPHHIVPTLFEAARVICAVDGPRRDTRVETARHISEEHRPRTERTAASEKNDTELTEKVDQ